MNRQANLRRKHDGGGGGGDDDSDSGGLSLPEDIILEVLARLPAKALCRFQCVSKAWRAVISDPAFVAAQRSRATGPFIVAVFGSWPEHELRLLDKGGNVLRVFDVTRGGTASLAPTRLDLIFVDRGEHGAAIIDPASGRHFTVVGTNDPPPSWWAPASTLSTAMIDYSFGRAAASGDYKVLRLVTWSRWHGNGSGPWCEVATIMDGGAEPTCWRRRPWGPFLDTGFSREDKATVDGVLYFMPYNTHLPFHARNRIVTFDLESEEWIPETIKCPPLERKKEDEWHIALTELKGTLCLVQNIRHPASLGGHYVNIWLLMDPHKSIWVKEYRIQMPERLLLFTKPLDVLGDGTMLLLVNMSQKAGNNATSYFRYILQFYNSSTENFTDFMEMALERFTGVMTFYTGSLQS